MPPPISGRYRLEAQLGAGGAGTVHRATDLQLRRPVAVKRLDAGVATDAILREARAVSALNHPNICTVHEVIELEGCPCIVMELIEGRSLAEVIPPGGLRAELTIRCGSEIAGALAHAHERGIIHRDLKSANVMLTDEGRVKLLDFGLARQLRDSHGHLDTEKDLEGPADGAISGTLPYMSPDVLEGAAPVAADDVWSLGVVLYEMATGALPFQGVTAFQIASSIQRDAPNVLPSAVPSGLRTVILRCLTRDPQERYRHANEVRAALELIELDPGSSSAVARHLRGPGLVAAALVILAVITVSAAGLLKSDRDRDAPPTALASIAVLPFTDEGTDPDLEYLAAGLAESVISSLARVPGKLSVTAWSEVQAYKGRTLDTAAIGQQLRVGTILRGTLTRQGDSCQLVVELIRVSDQSRIWGERFDAKLIELLDVQHEIAGRISSALRIALTRDEQRALAKPHSGNAEAYLQYLQGLHHLYRWYGPQDRQLSLDFFNRALSLDPAYASAHAGKARALFSMVYEGLLPPTAFPEAREAALAALSLDGTIGAAHLVLAELKFAYEWNVPEAEREFQLALALSPRDQAVLRHYGRFLRAQRHWDEAIAWGKRAVEVNPVSADTTKALGVTYAWAGRYDLAIEEYRKALALDPTHSQAHELMADAYAARGMYAEALESRRRYLQLEGALEAADTIGALPTASAYRQTMIALHKLYLQRLQTAAAEPGAYVSPMEFAFIYIGLEDSDRAFAALEQAFSERAAWLANIAADPAFDPLRADPRFADLLKRIGAPPQRSPARLPSGRP